MNAIAYTPVALDDFEETSAVHPRFDVDEWIVAPRDGEPSPIYFELMGRRFFLGVQFPTGLIPSETWQTEMRASGVPDLVMFHVRRWLGRHEI